VPGAECLAGKEEEMKILNAFSMNMLDPTEIIVDVRRALLSLAEARLMLEGTTDFESAVGHIDTAKLFSEQLGVPILPNRINILLRKGDTALVGQHVGTRLPEGATQLPEGARIDWMFVQIL
jgi:hypothetical protein